MAGVFILKSNVILLSDIELQIISEAINELYNQFDKPNDEVASQIAKTIGISVDDVFKTVDELAITLPCGSDET